MSDDLPHSVIYFGDARDHWWNADFVALCARRLDLQRFSRVLDVGCGYGHWTRTWLPHVAPGAAITGIDPEASSLAEADQRTRAFIAQRGLTSTLTWHQAAVESLPFPDGAFDLAIVQTVLIHLRDIAPAIDELHRVVAPGGMLLLAEPNNLAGAAGQVIDGPQVDTERALAFYELELRIQQGKHALGEGHNSAGEYVVRYLDAARFDNVRTWLSDRPYPLIPPYASAAVKAEIAELREFSGKGWFGRPPDEARRYYLAGGGTVETFERVWPQGLEFHRQRLAAIDAGTVAVGGGGVFYLIAATRR